MNLFFIPNEENIDKNDDFQHSAYDIMYDLIIHWHIYKDNFMQRKIAGIFTIIVIILSFLLTVSIQLVILISLKN